MVSFWRRRHGWACVLLVAGCAQILGIEEGTRRTETGPQGGVGAGAGGEGAFGGAGGSGGAPGDPLEVIWAQRYGATTDEFLAAISIDLDQIAVAGSHNGSFMVGTIAVPGYGGSDVFAMLLDTAREPLWARGWGDSQSRNQYAIGVAQHPNEPHTYLTGYFQVELSLDTENLVVPAANQLDGFVVRIGDDGFQNSAYAFPGPGTQFPGPIATVPVLNQNLLITGSTTGDMAIAGGTVNASGPARGFVARIYGGGSGQPDWAVPFGTQDSQEALGIATDGGNRIAVVGKYVGSLSIDGMTSFAGTYDAFIAVLLMGMSTGTGQWLTTIGSSGDEVAHAVAIAEDGDVVVAGTFSQDFDIGATTLTITDGNPDMFVARFDADSGDPVWATSIESQGLIPKAIVVSGDRLIVGANLDGVVTFSGAQQTSADADIVAMTLAIEDGSPIAARVLGGIDDQQVVGMVRTSSDTVVMGGNLVGTMDLDGHFLESAGSSDIFLAELSP